MRRSAAEALGVIKDERAVVGLLEALKNEDSAGPVIETTITRSVITRINSISVKPPAGRALGTPWIPTRLGFVKIIADAA